MMVTSGNVRRSIERFQSYSEALLDADINNFDDTRKTLLSFCEKDESFRIVHQQLQNLINEEFDTWLQQAMQTGGSLVGSGTLSFPENTEDRMAYMYEIVRRVNDGRINFIGFSIQFFAVSSRISDMIHAFNRAITSPLVTELNFRLSEIEENLPENPRDTVPGTIIQIIHNSSNVVLQSAQGNANQQQATVNDNDKLLEYLEELRRAVEEAIEDVEGRYDAVAIVHAAKTLVEVGKAKPSVLKTLFQSLPQTDTVLSIVASILSILGG